MKYLREKTGLFATLAAFAMLANVLVASMCATGMQSGFGTNAHASEICTVNGGAMPAQGNGLPMSGESCPMCFSICAATLLLPALLIIMLRGFMPHPHFAAASGLWRTSARLNTGFLGRAPPLSA